MRPEPIPVYAEMGSTNPVFILPGATREKKESLVPGMVFSVTLGAGQFCTNPGLILMEESENSTQLLELATKAIKAANSSTMLTCGIQSNFENGLDRLCSMEAVTLLARGMVGEGHCQGVAALLKTSAQTFLENPEMEEEVFGPSTLVVVGRNRDELITVAASLKGHLTATLWGTNDDLEGAVDLIKILQRKAGRLIVNGWLTGVEVCQSMVHGGPYPATTDSRTTSVGTAAITRFTRPVCYQDFPDALLPDALRDSNPLGISRLVN